MVARADWLLRANRTNPMDENSAQNSRLEFYLSLNRECTVEKLSAVTSLEPRKALTVYRLYQHGLGAETDRYRQTRTGCALYCTQNKVETELDFLTLCPNHTQIKNTLFPSLSQNLMSAA